MLDAVETQFHFFFRSRLLEARIHPPAQFIHPVDYSVGSVRNHVVHMTNIEDRWFSGLRGEPVPDFVKFDEYADRTKIHEKSESVITRMQAFLKDLKDEDLLSQPFGDTDPTALWQVLYHVANHGTDHRAQLLRILNELGIKTFPQDYIIYTWQQRK